MLSLNSGYRYYIYRGITDFRCGMDSLSGTVGKELSIDPTGGEIFIFFNAAHDSPVALIAGLEQVNRAFGAVRGMLSATMYLLTCTKPPRNTVGAIQVCSYTKTIHKPYLVDISTQSKYF